MTKEKIIERLKKAKGPDRKIDDAIARLEGYKGSPLPYTNYTSSLDAAYTLIDVGRRWLVRNHDGESNNEGDGKGMGGFANVYGDDDELLCPTFAATPIIALCIAALSVRH